jgi:hypothetical protein
MFAVVGVILGFMVLTTMAFARNPNPGVLPPNSHPHGKTYEEWEAKWWQAAFAIPVVNGDHPIISGGAFGGEDGVLFLAAVVGSAVTVNLTIPPGTALFFPVVNTECSEIEAAPFHGDDEASRRDCANGIMDNTSGLFAVIDGKPVNNLDAYRVESPEFVFGPLPQNNILGAPAGATSPSVDAGVYLFLAPLSVGQHVIRVGGTFDEFGLSIDTTFIITVAPGKP